MNAMTKRYCMPHATPDNRWTASAYFAAAKGGRTDGYEMLSWLVLVYELGNSLIRRCQGMQPLPM